jgi:hypothetical protein
LGLSLKIAPVSADLLIKLAIAAAVVGLGIYAVRRASAAAGSIADQISAGLGSIKDTVGGAIDTVTALPGQIADYAIEGARTGGAAWQSQTAERPPDQQEFIGKYEGPLVNDSGYDFGQLSG